MKLRIPLQLVLFCTIFPALGYAETLPPEKERKLLELEAQVSALEQKAFELKQKIQVIGDKVFRKKYGTSKPRIVLSHINRMPSYFRITQIEYWLQQGSQKKDLQKKTTTVQNPLENQWQIFQGNVEPGSYTLHVQATIQGYNPVLTYINSYRINLGNQLPLQAVNDKTISARVEFIDRGGQNINQRLRIIFRVTR